MQYRAHVSLDMHELVKCILPQSNLPFQLTWHKKKTLVQVLPRVLLTNCISIIGCFNVFTLLALMDIDFLSSSVLDVHEKKISEAIPRFGILKNLFEKKSLKFHRNHQKFTFIDKS